MVFRNLFVFTILIIVSGIWGCSGNMRKHPADSYNNAEEAVAVIHPLPGNDVGGIVRFTSMEPRGVRIQAEIKGLTPGKHGFHIHQYGDCSAPDGSPAGGHFNPHGGKHGAPDDPGSHVGDLGNLEADSNGIAVYNRINTKIELSGNDSIIGRSIIIHEGEDDLKTDPSGGSGRRIACGVIGLSSK
jgi:Cu-Zn family superoxide dismutase